MFVSSLTQFLLLLTMPSLSSSTPYISSTLPYPQCNKMLDSFLPTPVSSISSIFYFTHLHCRLYCECSHNIFIFANASHIVTATPAAQSSVPRCCCNFRSIAAILCGSSIDKGFATKKALPFEAPAVAPR